MRRLVLKADISVDGVLVRDDNRDDDRDDDRGEAPGPDEHLESYQRRVVQKAGVHALEADWTVDALAARKGDGGEVDVLAPIVAEGGAEFCQELSRRRLVDEYRIVVRPVVLGEGDRLFAAADRLYLIGTRFFADGTLAHTYVPVEAYRDHPPPYPWSVGSQSPGQDDHDPDA
jgi:riboflavin biosynthesis pyrimidine reductase